MDVDLGPSSGAARHLTHHIPVVRPAGRLRRSQLLLQLQSPTGRRAKKRPVAADRSPLPVGEGLGVRVRVPASWWIAPITNRKRSLTEKQRDKSIVYFLLDERGDVVQPLQSPTAPAPKRSWIAIPRPTPSEESHESARGSPIVHNRTKAKVLIKRRRQFHNDQRPHSAHRHQSQLSFDKPAWKPVTPKSDSQAEWLQGSGAGHVDRSKECVGVQDRQLISNADPTRPIKEMLSDNRLPQRTDNATPSKGEQHDQQKPESSGQRHHSPAIDGKSLKELLCAELTSASREAQISQL